MFRKMDGIASQVNKNRSMDILQLGKMYSRCGRDHRMFRKIHRRVSQNKNRSMDILQLGKMYIWCRCRRNMFRKNHGRVSLQVNKNRYPDRIVMCCTMCIR